MAKKRRRSTSTKRRGNRVIIYIRVSDTTGREDTLISDHVQLDQCNRLIRMEGLVAVGQPIVEKDKTGRESKNRAIAEIINRVESGEVDGVVVWKISRWGRNTMDSMLNIGELQEAGGFILSATENLDDIDTPAGKFSLTVLLAIAQMYSDEIGKTWANIHDYRRSLGKTHNGSPRLGYISLKHIPEAERHGYSVVEGCDYVVDPIKGPWVAKAYEWYVSGVSLLTVATRLDEAGIRSTRGTRITYNSLLASLDGGFAAGYVVDRRGEEEVFLRGTQEPLISQETWERYLRRRREQVAPRTKSAPYRLAGLLRCGGCGGSMSVTFSRTGKPGVDGKRPLYRYFRCNQKSKATRSNPCTNPVTITEVKAERLVLEWLQTNSTGQPALDAAIARAHAADRAEVDVAKIDRDIARLEKRMSILYDDKLAGEVSATVYKMKETEMLADLERLRSSRAAAKVTVEVNSLPSQTTFGALLMGWEHLTPDVYNQALRQVIRHVVITKRPMRDGGSVVRVVGAWEPDLQIVRAG